MKNKLPLIDYTKNHSTSVPMERCPTGAIVWIEVDGTIRKGAESSHVFRKDPLKIQTS